jgi:small-conductance mechanosensitive channel
MKEKLLESFQHLFDEIVSAAPKVAIGIVLIVGALIIAKAAEVVLRILLTRLRFDSLVERVGVDRALQRIGLRQQLNLFIPRLVYFLILFLLAQTAADALGLTAVSSAFAAFFAYLPNIVAALLLVVLGSTVGQFAGDIVAQSGQSSGIDFAPALGKLVSGLILFVVTMMAISQLKIDTGMVRIVTSFILGGAALAFGIAFGLGTRDVVRNLVAGFYVRKFLEVGKRLEIAGQRGTLTAIMATHTILREGEQDVSVANTTFLEHSAKQ